MKKVNVRNFTETAKRFITCVRIRDCGLCNLRRECNDLLTAGEPGYAQQMADMLDILLPELESYTDLSGEEFLRILIGGGSNE